MTAAKSKWIDSASDSDSDNDADAKSNVIDEQKTKNTETSVTRKQTKASVDQLLESVTKPEFLLASKPQGIGSYSKADEKAVPDEETDEKELTARDLARAFEPSPRMPGHSSSLRERVAKLDNKSTENRNKATEKETAKVFVLTVTFILVNY